MADYARKGFKAIQNGLRRIGLDIRYVGTIRESIPDSYLYRPYFSPWLSSEWSTLLESDNVMSLVTSDRKYVLWTLLLQAVRTLTGDVVECGVYRGGTAKLFAKLLEGCASDKSLHLFDTFEGMPETMEGLDLHRKGDFSDTSLESVRKYLSNFQNVEYHQGLIPASFAGLAELELCFAHIDLDLYEAIYAATEFLYPRLQRGGVLVYDDFGLASCPGARKAVEQFFASKAEVPLVLQTGQCIVVKA